MIVIVSFFLITICHSIVHGILRNLMYDFLDSKKIPYNSWDRSLTHLRITKEAKYFKKKYFNKIDIVNKMDHLIKFGKINNWIYLMFITALLVIVIFY